MLPGDTADTGGSCDSCVVDLGGLQQAKERIRILHSELYWRYLPCYRCSPPYESFLETVFVDDLERSKFEKSLSAAFFWSFLIKI